MKIRFRRNWLVLCDVGAVGRRITWRHWTRRGAVRQFVLKGHEFPTAKLRIVDLDAEVEHLMKID